MTLLQKKRRPPHKGIRRLCLVNGCNNGTEERFYLICVLSCFVSSYFPSLDDCPAAPTKNKKAYHRLSVSNFTLFVKASSPSTKSIESIEPIESIRNLYAISILLKILEFLKSAQPGLLKFAYCFSRPCSNSGHPNLPMSAEQPQKTKSDA